MNRISSYQFVLLSFFLIGLGSSCKRPISSDQNRPNVLFLFADDQRAGTIHAQGNNVIITPAIDQLVENGISFTQNYIMGSNRPAVCAPSRAMMLTGRDLFRINKEDFSSDILSDTETLPETLKNAGYETFGTGKQHNGKASFARGFTAGDEIFFGGMSDHWTVPVYHFDSTGKYDKKVAFVKDFASGNVVEYKNNCDHVVEGKHSSELFADAAIRFLKNRRSEKPFFAYVSFTAPHDPRTMPKQYEEMYDTSDITVPPNFMPVHPWDFGEMKIRDELLASFPRTTSEMKNSVRDYYAMITHLDEQIGRIIEALKESGEFDNTIIIYSADNGLAVGQHGMYGKQNLYEHSVRVPLIISGPGIPKNVKNSDLHYLFDLYPSLCDLLSIQTPESVEGKSFAKSITNDENAGRDSLFFAYKEFMRAYRKGDHKIIEYFVNGDRHSQLFNVKEDPFEINNLVENPDFADRYSQMKNDLIQTMKMATDNSTFYQQLVKEIE